MKLIRDIKAYQPYNEQEQRDKEEILRRLESGEPLLGRDNLSAHLTASAWVTNPDRDRVLMVYHNLYRSWSWMGGHADGEEDLLAVAIREVKEESGVSQVAPVSEEIYSLEILTVEGHEKRGEYVPSHLHLNLTYLLEADPDQPIRIKPDENSQVGWFGLREGVEASTEPWFRQRIYSKLNEKLKMKKN
ncbi:MAG: NUDIX hydrolase [Oscillospiraceae bacterium]|nr:NUDIX hydrolase [Oscillospiraceae bacterium]